MEPSTSTAAAPRSGIGCYSPRWKGALLSQHPLIELAADPRVRRASEFRGVAAGLTGAQLAEAFAQEVTAAPLRHEAKTRHFVAYNRRLAGTRRPARDSEHLSLALVEHCQRTKRGFAIPDGRGELDPVAAQVVLAASGSESVDMGRLDVLGLCGEGRLAIAQIRFLAPGATRAGTGDTPLSALLEALALAAVVQANREALASEVASACGRALAEGPPLVALLASPRYWELCRRREAQKGAAWIRELERIARELEEASGISLVYLGCRLAGDPGWSYPEGSPVLDAAPQLAPAWEASAGRVRPKAPPRPRAAAPVEVRIEADPSRPVRPYAPSEQYSAGDRISHPKLGLGVVQGAMGPAKIHVRFDDRRVVLVHARPAAPAASASIA
jgi:hypothetical protein